MQTRPLCLDHLFRRRQLLPPQWPLQTLQQRAPLSSRSFTRYRPSRQIRLYPPHLHAALLGREIETSRLRPDPCRHIDLTPPHVRRYRRSVRRDIRHLWIMRLSLWRDRGRWCALDRIVNGTKVGFGANVCLLFYIQSGVELEIPAHDVNVVRIDEERPGQVDVARCEGDQDGDGE